MPTRSTPARRRLLVGAIGVALVVTGCSSTSSDSGPPSSSIRTTNVVEALQDRRLQERVSLTDPTVSSVVDGPAVVVGTAPKESLTRLARICAVLIPKVREFVRSEVSADQLVLVPADAGTQQKWEDEQHQSTSAIAIFKPGLRPYILVDASFAPQIDAPDTVEVERTMGHELTHVLARPAQGVPLWIAEGFAGYVTNAVNDLTINVPKQPGKHLPTDAEFGSQTTGEDAYLLSGQFFEFLNEKFSAEAVLTFYKSAGSDWKPAFKKAFGKEADGVVKQWVAD